jgi:hypothetical protein
VADLTAFDRTVPIDIDFAGLVRGQNESTLEPGSKFVGETLSDVGKIEKAASMVLEALEDSGKSYSYIAALESELANLRIPSEQVSATNAARNDWTSRLVNTELPVPAENSCGLTGGRFPEVGVCTPDARSWRTVTRLRKTA